MRPAQAQLHQDVCFDRRQGLPGKVLVGASEAPALAGRCTTGYGVWSKIRSTEYLYELIRSIAEQRPHVLGSLGRCCPSQTLAQNGKALLLISWRPPPAATARGTLSTRRWYYLVPSLSLARPPNPKRGRRHPPVLPVARLSLCQENCTDYDVE